MSPPMTVINYPRHFACLVFGAIVVFAVLQLHDVSIFVLSNGFLHAVAVICALRSAASWLRRALFAAIAPILSIAAFKVMTLLPSAAAQYVGYCLVSVVGAASYWGLVRVFWIHSLRFRSLLSALSLCAAVTLLWDLTFRHSLFFAVKPLILTIHTLCWWLAFSFSLYLSERAYSRHSP
jgi:hypothetical protein